MVNGEWLVSHPLRRLLIADSHKNITRGAPHDTFHPPTQKRQTAGTAAAQQLLGEVPMATIQHP